MADQSPVSVALISIHPRFANAILDGTKLVEFRKIGFRRQLTHILIYATAPIQQVVGYAEVEAIDQRSPDSLWRRYRRVAGIEREAFFRYYRDRETGVALKVRRAKRLIEPLLLDDLHLGATPPQSFLYSTEAALRVVQARATSRDSHSRSSTRTSQSSTQRSTLNAVMR